MNPKEPSITMIDKGPPSCKRDDAGTASGEGNNTTGFVRCRSHASKRSSSSATPSTMSVAPHIKTSFPVDDEACAANSFDDAYRSNVCGIESCGNSLQKQFIARDGIQQRPQCRAVVSSRHASKIFLLRKQYFSRMQRLSSLSRRS